MVKSISLDAIREAVANLATTLERAGFPISFAMVESDPNGNDKVLLGSPVVGRTGKRGIYRKILDEIRPGAPFSLEDVELVDSNTDDRVLLVRQMLTIPRPGSVVPIRDNAVNGRLLPNGTLFWTS